MSVRGSAVTPQFLCWYLNQPATGQKLLSMLSGTNMPMLGKHALASLPVTVPPLDMQERIVRLNFLWEYEKQVTQQLLLNREKMLSGIFHRLLES
jgi:restriction endonuclease S subunit